MKYAQLVYIMELTKAYDHYTTRRNVYFEQVG